MVLTVLTLFTQESAWQRGFPATRFLGLGMSPWQKERAWGGQGKQSSEQIPGKALRDDIGLNELGGRYVMVSSWSPPRRGPACPCLLWPRPGDSLRLAHCEELRLRSNVALARTPASPLQPTTSRKILIGLVDSSVLAVPA